VGKDTIVVTGAGGFIGGHLVAALRKRGPTDLRAIDVKPVEQWKQSFADVDNVCADLSDPATCRRACAGAKDVYHLAADMGGAGFVEGNKAKCMLNVLPDTQMLVAARDAGVDRFFYASTAGVYNVERQRGSGGAALKESDAYPAMPEDGYGWEKLFVERTCRHFEEDFGLRCRVARIHNVYGPYAAWDGGREKAPAAMCRKVIHAKASGEHRIEIWGDGRQTRSFTYIDDCIEGIARIMDAAGIDEPVNLGSSELVTINELVGIVEEIAGIELERSYLTDAPKGVDGRNSDNALIRSRLGWEPSTALRDGMAKTYAWIAEQYAARTAGM
jgi:nucleoside-diphosphate-sugar epimerase